MTFFMMISSHGNPAVNGFVVISHTMTWEIGSVNGDRRKVCPGGIGDGVGFEWRMAKGQ